MEPERKTEKSGQFGFGRKAACILAGILIFTAAAAFFVHTAYVPFQGMLLKRSAQNHDLRGYALTVEEYRQLQAQLPECHITWDIPIGGQRFDSSASSITISSLDAADIALFGLFDDLDEIVATDARCYEELQQLQQYLPECSIQWGIHLADGVYSPSETALDLSGTGVDCNQLMTELAWFPGLKQVEILDNTFEPQQKAALLERYPEITFVWTVEAAGKTWLNTDTCLSYAGEYLDVVALAAAADSFYGVEELDLAHCGCTTEELLTLYHAFNGPKIHSELSLWGQEFTTEVTQLDFSGMKITDTSELEEMLPLMPDLEKVDMCDCGISNEDMDALNRRHENVQFVWRVHFSVYSLRTDAIQFCASNLPGNGYVAIKMTDKQLEPLKYCTELIALDLGHMLYTDLSFLENMPKLQYLILVEARFTDITPIGTLKDLKYLELFVNTIDDLSPLLNCTELKHLNIGYTSGFDTEVLKQMTQLERLWYPGNKMSSTEVEELIAALPNTKCHLPAGDPNGSTGAGWREADIYYEMRNIFSMHYMPGGTGMNRE